MRQDENASKENRRPPGMAERQQCPDVLGRRPLGERRNKRDVEPCIKWLQGTVARSRVVKEAPPKSPPKPAKAPSANAPPAQPSCSPDIIRKKSSRELEACFGMGPAVKSDVKDRRKSKPRALLTVDVHKELAKVTGKGIPKPGRASLEWISDDPDDSTSDSGTAGDVSSGGSSSCTVTQGWETPRATHTYGNTDLWQQAWYLESFSSPSGTEWSKTTTTTTSTVFSSDVDTVVGAYESCHPTSHPVVLSASSVGTCFSPLSDQCEFVEEAKDDDATNASTKLKRAHFGEIKSGVSSISALPSTHDSLSEQVRSLQMELKGLLRSESWK